MLGVLGSNLKMVKNFYATFVNVACCCSRLAWFVQQCCVWACALGRFVVSFDTTCKHWFLSLNMAESGAQFELCKNSKKSPTLEGRPCLWNIYEKCHHSREVGETGFQEISRALVWLT